MKHTREEIIKALHVIKDTCSDETIDCDNCPFGNDGSLCRLNRGIPANWRINEEDNRYLTLIWEREEPKEMTMAELEEKLGYKVKIVKEHE